MAWAHGLVQISIHSAARAETTEEGFVADARQIFQSTPPRGRRQSYPGHGPRAALHFNPLRREGGDEMLVIVGQVAFISIHSAARAETNTFNNIIVIQINFNPLRREGGDYYSV